MEAEVAEGFLVDLDTPTPEENNHVDRSAPGATKTGLSSLDVSSRISSILSSGIKCPQDEDDPFGLLTTPKPSRPPVVAAVSTGLLVSIDSPGGGIFGNDAVPSGSWSTTLSSIHGPAAAGVSSRGMTLSSVGGLLSPILDDDSFSDVFLTASPPESRREEETAEEEEAICPPADENVEPENEDWQRLAGEAQAVASVVKMTSSSSSSDVRKSNDVTVGDDVISDISANYSPSMLIGDNLDDVLVASSPDAVSPVKVLDFNDVVDDDDDDEKNAAKKSVAVEDVSGRGKIEGKKKTGKTNSKIVKDSCTANVDNLKEGKIEVNVKIEKDLKAKDEAAAEEKVAKKLSPEVVRPLDDDDEDVAAAVFGDENADPNGVFIDDDQLERVIRKSLEGMSLRDETPSADGGGESKRQQVGPQLSAATHKTKGSSQMLASQRRRSSFRRTRSNSNVNKGAAPTVTTATAHRPPLKSASKPAAVSTPLAAHKPAAAAAAGSRRSSFALPVRAPTFKSRMSLLPSSADSSGHSSASKSAVVTSSSITTSTPSVKAPLLRGGGGVVIGSSSKAAARRSMVPSGSSAVRASSASAARVPIMAAPTKGLPTPRLSSKLNSSSCATNSRGGGVRGTPGAAGANQLFQTSAAARNPVCTPSRLSMTLPRSIPTPKTSQPQLRSARLVPTPKTNLQQQSKQQPLSVSRRLSAIATPMRESGALSASNQQQQLPSTPLNSHTAKPLPSTSARPRRSLMPCPTLNNAAGPVPKLVKAAAAHSGVPFKLSAAKPNTRRSLVPPK